MALRLGSAVINCADLELMTAFWCSALGLKAGPAVEDGAFRVLGGEHVNVSLQVARTPVTARDQMHLDLYTADKSHEVQRLIDLGATWVRSSGDHDDYDVLLIQRGTRSASAWYRIAPGHWPWGCDRADRDERCAQ